MRAHTITTKARVGGGDARSARSFPAASSRSASPPCVFGRHGEQRGRVELAYYLSEEGPSVTSGTDGPATLQGEHGPGTRRHRTGQASDELSQQRLNIVDRVRCQPSDHYQGAHSTYRAPTDDEVDADPSVRRQEAAKPAASPEGRACEAKFEVTGDEALDTEWHRDRAATSSARASTVTYASALQHGRARPVGDARLRNKGASRCETKRSALEPRGCRN